MTLSHCWGTEGHLTTSTETLAERKAGIRIPDLPPTFRDAVQITRHLGIKYLWIDSLCILQDNISDWEKESALMGSIYSTSYLNIVATHSGDSRGGCFSKRWVPLESSIVEDIPSKLSMNYYEIAGNIPSEKPGIYVRLSLNLAHEEMSKFGSGEYTGAGYGWRPHTDTAPLVSHCCFLLQNILSTFKKKERNISLIL
jgi:Heterokaryon incompatibility protein (HET)